MISKQPSYCDNVKKEIYENKKFARDCCKMSMLYGLLLFSGTYRCDLFRLNVKNTDVIKKVCTLADELCGVQLSVSAGERNYSVTAEGEDALKLFDIMGNSNKDTALRLNRAVLDCDMCPTAFATGAFLACGTVASPEREYRIEFDIPGKKRAQDLVLLLEEIISKPSVSVRKSSYVVYFRESGVIEDFLNLMGAKGTIFDVINAKIEKDIRNRTNREQNVSLANMKKSIDAAVYQCRAIDFLEKSGRLRTLPDDIKEIAALRTDNPNMPLSELSALSGYGKSYINRRLIKLTALAENK